MTGMELKLEVGGVYYRRDGTVSPPLEGSPQGGLVRDPETNMLYDTKDPEHGWKVLSVSGINHRYDLVQEKEL